MYDQQLDRTMLLCVSLAGLDYEAWVTLNRGQVARYGWPSTLSDAAAELLRQANGGEPTKLLATAASYHGEVHLETWPAVLSDRCTAYRVLMRGWRPSRRARLLVEVECPSP